MGVFIYCFRKLFIIFKNKRNLKTCLTGMFLKTIIVLLL